MLLGVLSVGDGLAARVLAVDEEFDGAVLVRFHLLHDSLIERVHVKFVEHNCCNQRLTCQVKLDILLQVIERVLVSFHKDQVEALLSQIVSVNAASLGARTVDYGRVGC